MPHIDFDAAKEEALAGREPLTMTIGGRDYEWPATTPAALQLERASLRRELRDAGVDPDDPSTNIPPDAQLRLFRAAIGDKRYGELLDAGQSMEDLVLIFNTLNAFWAEPYSNPNLAGQMIRNGNRLRVVTANGAGGKSNSSLRRGTSLKRTSGANTA